MAESPPTGMSSLVTKSRTTGAAMSTTPDPSAPPSLGSDQELSDALLEGMRSDRESEDARSDGLDDEDIGGGSGESGDGRPTMTGGTRVDEVTAHHDVVFRDKISNYYGASRAPAREPSPLPVGRDVLDDIRHAFVFPDRFQEIVVKQSFLILRVRVGQGGSTAAMRLALDAGASTIKELAPDTKLRWLTTARMENGVGYVLCNAASAVLGELNEFEVGRLREAHGRDPGRRGCAEPASGVRGPRRPGRPRRSIRPHSGRCGEGGRLRFGPDPGSADPAKQQQLRGMVRRNRPVDQVLRHRARRTAGLLVRGCLGCRRRAGRGAPEARGQRRGYAVARPIRGRSDSPT